MSAEADTSVFLKLIRILDPEGKIDDWSKFEQSPEQLLDYIANHFFIDPAKLTALQRFFIGENRPELDTIWFNNSVELPFIGIPIGGEFVKFFRYPANSPFILLDPKDLQSGAIQMTEDEIAEYGLPELSGSAFWAILKTTT